MVNTLDCCHLTYLPHVRATAHVAITDSTDSDIISVRAFRFGLLRQENRCVEERTQENIETLIKQGQSIGRVSFV